MIEKFVFEVFLPIALLVLMVSAIILAWGTILNFVF